MLNGCLLPITKRLIFISLVTFMAVCDAGAETGVGKRLLPDTMLDVGNRWDYDYTVYEVDGTAVELTGAGFLEVTGHESIRGYDTCSVIDSKTISGGLGTIADKGNWLFIGEDLVEVKSEDAEAFEIVSADQPNGNPWEIMPVWIEESAFNLPFSSGDYQGEQTVTPYHTWSGQRSSKITYLGEEAVFVPAGTFTCTKVLIYNQWLDDSGWHGYNDSTFWMHPELGLVRRLTEDASYDSNGNLDSSHRYEAELTGVNFVCLYSIDPESAVLGAVGGSGSFQLATQTGCGWAATSDAEWLSVSETNSGTGGGDIAYTATPNTIGRSRTGRIAVADQIFTVTQPANPGGVLQFEKPTVYVDEGSSSVSIAVARVGGSTGAVSVEYTTSDITAVAGVDYFDANGAISWADGEQSEKNITVTLDPSRNLGSDKTVLLSLSNPDGGALIGGQSNAVLVIRDIYSGQLLRVPEDYDTIQEAVDAAADGDAVVVADGVYTGEGNTRIDIYDKAIVLKSRSGPDNCVIDGQEQYWSGVEIRNNGDKLTVLDGFTIRRFDRGVFNHEASSVIRNCTIELNIEGIEHTYYSHLRVEDCEIINNTSQGIRSGVGTASTLTIHNTKITGNGSNGIGATIGTIVNTIVSNNGNHGIEFNENGETLVISNCLIAGNQRSGVKSWVGNGTAFDIKSSTIAGNGEYGVLNDNIRAIDTIVWGNINAVWANASNQITYSDIQGGHTGTGNIDAAPLFIGNGDYHLPPNSPCIDAGSSGATTGYDIDGELRPQGPGRVADMGVDEVFTGSAVADFIAVPTVGSVPLEVSFIDLSSGNPASRTWHFGDGAQSSDLHPVHTYTTPQRYTVDLKITAGGVDSTRTRADYITAGVGSIKVTIEPDRAVDEGAKWAIDGGAWRDSGQTEAWIAAGARTVALLPVSGWEMVEEVAVEIVPGKTTEILVPYTFIPTTPDAATGDASPVSHISATLNGVVNANGAETTYHIQYGETPSLEMTSYSQLAGDGLNALPVTLTIAPLKSETNYYFRIVAENSEGTTYGAVDTFTTLSADAMPVVHVPSEYATIQAAIDAVPENGLVAVSPGTYRGTGNRNIDFDGKSLILSCTDRQTPDECIIDCEGLDRAFTFSSGESTAAIVSNFTMINGYADVFGGGAHFSRDASALFLDCTIAGGQAERGGAIYTSESTGNDARPVFMGCTITGNTAENAGGGAFLGSAGGAVFDSCRIEQNNARIGGGFWIDGPNVAIDRNAISNNTASSFGGGIGSQYAVYRITNSIIHHNTAPTGGGIYATNHSNMTLLNSTVADNEASASTTAGGGLYYGSTPAPTVKNCIFWGNSSQIDYSYGDIIDVRYSAVQGGHDGVGNIDANPHFMGENDYRLIHSSSCIDKGAALSSINEDYNGVARPQGPTIDIGAYEYIPQSVYLDKLDALLKLLTHHDISLPDTEDIDGDGIVGMPEALHYLQQTADKR